MAILTGYHVLPTLAGINNPNLSKAHWSFAWVAQFSPTPFVNKTQSSVVGPLQTAWPVEANSKPLAGVLQRSHLDDYYNRIHISPQSIDLGNVTSTQVTPVQLWNAYLAPITLEQIVGLDEGIIITGQEAAPFEFAALKELTWQVAVTPDGLPVLDTKLAWQFDNGAAPSVRITANRIISFTFGPDWSEPVRESLESLTDVMVSESAASQRRALRATPRREFAASIMVERRERQLLEQSLWGWSDRIWSLPIWAEIQHLVTGLPAESLFIPCATEHLDFHTGGLAMLRGRSAFESETVEISVVAANGLHLRRATQRAWPQGSALFPARSALLLKEPTLTKRTDQLQTLDVEFLVVEECHWPTWLPADLYRGRPIWSRRPDDSQNLTHAAERLRLTLDSGLGQPLVTDSGRRALQLIGQRHIDVGRAARAQIRSLIYALNGRQKTVWVPSHMDDLTVVAPMTSVSSTLDVLNIGYSRFGAAKPGRRDIRIELTTGQVFHRRIIACAEIDQDIERISLESALGLELAPDQFARISFMYLMRLESDRQEIEHRTDSEGVAIWATVFREERDDEF